jgi:hypothetical protein
MATKLTTVGVAALVDIMDGTAGAGSTGGSQKWIGSGTGTTTATSGDTTIETETSEARVSSTFSQPSANTNRLVGTITYGTSKTIANAGNLTSSSGGTLVVHGDFSGVAVLASDAIQFTIDLALS